MGKIFLRMNGGYFRGCLQACLIAPLAFWAGGAHAVNVGLAGILGGKAILVIDGGSPRILSVGQEYGGIRLLAVQGDGVQVDIDGKRRSLRVGQNAVGEASSGNAPVVLTADGQGHFQTTGSINGVSIRFLVDTGATAISLGASDARRLGLDMSKAERGISQTANGQTVVQRVKLTTVKVGDIVVHNVEGVVHAQDMPFALLGMSFLNRTDMQREGDKLTLKKRF
ncbi:MAG: TIGR02281 family clan AA aspartic protease [Azovibrio sp.]|uniref:retropepsin-like aspartic protease family protein n=2 Tax=Azovibrio sp. TaxID=1872673 RepID=UPI003C75B67B